MQSILRLGDGVESLMKNFKFAEERKTAALSLPEHRSHLQKLLDCCKVPSSPACSDDMAATCSHSLSVLKHSQFDLCN